MNNEIEEKFKNHKMLDEIKNIKGYNVHERLNLYIDMGYKCNGNCDFCITKTKERYSEKRKTYFDKQMESLKKISGMYYSVELIGGEPLLYSNNIRKMLNVIDCKKKVIVTNGIRNEWFNNIDLLKKFDHIDISRHAIEEDENQRIIKSNNLLNINDFRTMEKELKEKVRINVTCFKHGIDSFDKVESFINNFKFLGIKQFMFANLTNLKKDDFHDNELVEFTNKHRILDKEFESWQEKLINNGYKFKKEIIGYAHIVKILEKDGIVVVFKSNSEVNSTKTLTDYYKNNDCLLELVLAPDGSVYADWSYSQKVE